MVQINIHDIKLSSSIYVKQGKPGPIHIKLVSIYFNTMEVLPHIIYIICYIMHFKIARRMNIWSMI